MNDPILRALDAPATRKWLSIIVGAAYVVIAALSLMSIQVPVVYAFVLSGFALVIGATWQYLNLHRKR